ncbi:glutaredoxin family protein [Sporosarcina sp. Marseille-Q4063]|uniref:glutaredoxin family protein n=1 Tax=Sporosarcina sp. Marseille-Q4063 TaxID=2810514 RepID=UPI001BAF9C2A|nr:glutaredoxin family protein [Sporosarcina sp. Marseille-Q4063]QUW20736.1 glutaredoxin family protein [Sporosarcina sp. Marseille-Q4063]
MKHNVTVYTNTQCPVCRMVKDFLNDLDIPFNEINVDINPIAMIKLIVKTKRLTVPQTNINGEWISGFDPVGILTAINAKSEI